MVKISNTKAKTKGKYIKLDAACSLPLTSNRYNLLHNDINEDDMDNTHTGTSKFEKPLSNRSQRNRMRNYKKGYVKTRVRKVLILGDSHA